MPILTDAERIGTLVAKKYRLESILGRGGMGVVFAGTHTWTGRKVAVKLLKPEYASDPVIAKRFLQEAQSATKIRHPNVVDVLDMDEDLSDGTVYMALEFLEGETLASLLSRHGGKLDAEETLQHVLPVMGALAMAHERGIIHRDLKPENIFISVDATGRQTTKLLDFGIAKALEGRLDEQTRTGQVIGTPHYMSPEQALAAADVGAQTDIWSIGVVLYECLSGVCPFDGPTATAILLAITNEPAKPLREVAPDVPAKLCKVIDRAIVLDRQKRHRSMRAFVEALAGALAGTPLAMSLLRLAGEVMSFSRVTDPNAATVATSAAPKTGPVDHAALPGALPRPVRKTPFSIANTYLGERDRAERKKKWLFIAAGGLAVVAIVGGVFVAIGFGSGGGAGVPAAAAPAAAVQRAATARAAAAAATATHAPIPSAIVPSVAPAGTMAAPATPPAAPPTPAIAAVDTAPATAVTAHATPVAGTVGTIARGRPGHASHATPATPQTGHTTTAATTTPVVAQAPSGTAATPSATTRTDPPTRHFDPPAHVDHGNGSDPPALHRNF